MFELSSRRIHQRRRVSDSITEAKELKIQRATTIHHSNSSSTSLSGTPSRKSRTLSHSNRRRVTFTATQRTRSISIITDSRAPTTRASSPTTLFSPIRRCESPEADFPCDGNCREHTHFSRVNELFKDSADVVRAPLPPSSHL